MSHPGNRAAFYRHGNLCPGSGIHQWQGDSTPLEHCNNISGWMNVTWCTRRFVRVSAFMLSVWHWIMAFAIVHKQSKMSVTGLRWCDPSRTNRMYIIRFRFYNSGRLRPSLPPQLPRSWLKVKINFGFARVVNEKLYLSVHSHHGSWLFVCEIHLSPLDHQWTKSVQNLSRVA